MMPGLGMGRCAPARHSRPVSARIFISYRSSDGRDKAVALARDLGGVFGDGAVFLDKDDLRGGGRWASELAGTLRGRPVMLLLVTPHLLAADDTTRRLRIADAADPVRQEFDAARAAGAHIVPVLCDGVDALPPREVLGEPWAALHELTWRRLRAYDWQPDLDRLVADLRGLGVPERGGAVAAPRRRAMVGLLVGAGALAAAGAGWWAWVRHGSAARTEIAGRWGGAMPWLGEAVLVLTRPAPASVAVVSEPIAIAAQPAWAEYRAFWRERFGSALDAVLLRGEGRLIADPGQAVRVDIGFRLTPASGDEKIDGGNLSAALSADGRRLVGELWLNSRQQGAAVELVRR
jgi:hypothetical protein